MKNSGLVRKRVRLRVAVSLGIWVGKLCDCATAGVVYVIGLLRKEQESPAVAREDMLQLMHFLLQY